MNMAIAHNNNGVAFLVKGDIKNALLEFRSAAQMLYATTQELRKTGEERAFSCTISTVRSITQCHIPCCNTFIRSTPLSMEYEIQDEVTSCPVESAIILLNMAIAYHLDSLRPSVHSIPDALKNAISLYEMAYSLGLQIRDDNRTHDVILTSLNNLGQIHNELSNFEQSRLYLEDLSAYVVFLRDGDNERIVGHLHEFILNAMVLRNPNTCAGAA